MNQENEETIERIKRNTINGFPLGSPEFVKSMEEKYKSEFINKPVGRPRLTKRL